MGVSSSKDNDDLVDTLVRRQQIISKEAEKSFRLVDRGRYVPEKYKVEAYRDSPLKIRDEDAADWIPGRLHLSAPSMYAAVLEKLLLAPGLSFLNIGSGTGWFSTVAGYQLGNLGVNHGIEIHSNLVEYSEKLLEETVRCAEVNAYEWAKPVFFVGNGLAQTLPDGTKSAYDRIYCGGSLKDQSSIQRLIRLLEIGGRLIAPYKNALMCFVRTSETRYISELLMACQFADLIATTPNDKKNCLEAFDKVPSLKDMCRNAVRKSIRKHYLQLHPVKLRSICNANPSSAREHGHVVIIGGEGMGHHADGVEVNFGEGGGDLLAIFNPQNEQGAGRGVRLRVVRRQVRPTQHDRADGELRGEGDIPAEDADRNPNPRREGGAVGGFLNDLLGMERDGQHELPPEGEAENAQNGDDNRQARRRSRSRSPTPFEDEGEALSDSDDADEEHDRDEVMHLDDNMDAPGLFEILNGFGGVFDQLAPRFEHGEIPDEDEGDADERGEVREDINELRMRALREEDPAMRQVYEARMQQEGLRRHVDMIRRIDVYEAVRAPREQPADADAGEPHAPEQAPPPRRSRRIRRNVPESGSTDSPVGVAAPDVGSSDSVRGDSNRAKRARLNDNQEIAPEKPEVKESRLQRESLAVFGSAYKKAIIALPLPPSLIRYLRLDATDN